MNPMDPFTETFAQGAETFARNTSMFTKMWGDMATQMMSAGTSFSPSSAPTDMGRQMRNAFFTTMSEFTQEYLRSPQFLEIMRQTMDQSMNLRKQLDNFLAQTFHQFQGVAREDVDSLMLTVRHMERRLLDRMEELTERLEELSERVEALSTVNDYNREPKRSTSAQRKSRSAGRSASAAEERSARAGEAEDEEAE